MDMRINRLVGRVSLSVIGALGCAAIVAPGSHSKVHAQTGCSAQTLSGPYTYALSGEYFDAKGGLYHFSASGRIIFDGAGGAAGKDTTSDGAFITRGRQYNAGYTIASDCTGYLIFEGGTATLDFVVTNNNRNLNFIQADQSTNIAGTAQQQFPPQ